MSPMSTIGNVYPRISTLDTLGLMPQSIFMSAKKAYREFLKSDFWIKLSAEKRSGVTACENCGMRRRLQAHHIRYPSDWFKTTLADLRVLCRGCHENQHGIDTGRGGCLWDQKDVDRDIFFERCQWLRRRFQIVGFTFKRSRLKFLRRALKLWPKDRSIKFHVREVLREERLEQWRTW